MKKVIPALNTHIAITLRVEWLIYEPDGAYIRDAKEPKPTDLFKSTHLASRDDQYLWGYFGEYAHTHLGMGYGQSFPKRDRSKKEWKALYSKARGEERAYREYLEDQDPEPDGPGLYK